eukprot:TRINITY_DN3351_c0_g1_i1.p1 TRINITY_DN3351_c0_g1~~TRINITY_DN3351_c0_g1_i1.p1  ORF type:complete len:150 (-),score=24.62 TRINITY_DN3351_c0_g1_i1:258-707(-)
MGSFFARRVFLKQTGPELWAYFLESKLAAAIVGFQVAALTSFSSGMLFLALSADVPFSVPEFYRDERLREAEMVAKGQFGDSTSEFAQQVRIGIRIGAIGIALPIFFGALSVMAVVPITISVGASGGLLARYWLRRTIVKAAATAKVAH